MLQLSYTNLVGGRRERNDIVRVTGQWEGRVDQGHTFRFVATKI